MHHVDQEESGALRDMLNTRAIVSMSTCGEGEHEHF